MTTKECAICLQPLLDEEDKQWLVCGHQMHSYCISEFAAAKLGKDWRLEDVQCPQCKTTGQQAAEQAAELLGESEIVDGAPQPTLELLDEFNDATPPPPAQPLPAARCTLTSWLKKPSDVSACCDIPAVSAMSTQPEKQVDCQNPCTILSSQPMRNKFGVQFADAN